MESENEADARSRRLQPLVMRRLLATHPHSACFCSNFLASTSCPFLASRDHSDVILDLRRLLALANHVSPRPFQPSTRLKTIWSVTACCSPAISASFFESPH